MIDPGLRDKVVLVTGANNPFGIGAAIAEAFAARARPSSSRTCVGGRKHSGSMPPRQRQRRPQARRSTGRETPTRPTRCSTASVSMAARVGSAEIDLADAAAIPQLFDRVEKTWVRSIS